jgi:hypothetical protein
MAAGVATGVLEVVLATVDVVAVLGVVAVVGVVAAGVVAVGEGDTIAAGVVVLDEDVAVVDEDGAAAPGVWAAGLGVSLGIPLANGLRGTLATRTLIGTVAAVPPDGTAGTVTCVTGGVGIPFAAGALFNMNSGMATTAASSSATTGHSLCSSRSRRSERMVSLRSWWLPSMR